MRKYLFIATVALSSSLVAAETDVNRISQAFGHLIGKNLETPGVTFNTDQVIQGIRDAVAGKESPMTEEEYETAISELQERAFNEIAGNNLKRANSYLVENKAKEGIVELESGKLQYEVIQSGEGKVVAEHATPTIHYVGKYSDGSIFGSSEEGGGPITLPLDQTIPGFSKGIVGMKEGEKRRLYIHPDLGYGTGGHLEPNSLLVFEVEVITAEAQNSEVAELEIEAESNIR